MRAKRLLLIFLPFTMMSSCKKDAQKPNTLNGTYTGTFFSVGQNFKDVLPVGFTLKEGQFENVGPSGQLTTGHGNYVADQGSVNFNNLQDFTLQADYRHPFLREVALIADYKYTIAGDSLFLSKTLNGTVISYKMKKN